MTLAVSIQNSMCSAKERSKQTWKLPISRETSKRKGDRNVGERKTNGGKGTAIMENSQQVKSRSTGGIGKQNRHIAC